MLAGTFAEQLEETVTRAPASAEAEIAPTSEEEAAAFDPSEFDNTTFDFGGAYTGTVEPIAANEGRAAVPPAVPDPDPSGSVADSFPAPAVSTADLLKFLIDRTGYIKLLEQEDTPEAVSRTSWSTPPPIHAIVANRSTSFWTTLRSLPMPTTTMSAPRSLS
jgi:hypothetical protein